jgi:hypothetical protein
VVNRNAWIAVNGLSVSLAVFFCTGCGEQKEVGKIAGDRAEKVLFPDRAHLPDHPKVSLHKEWPALEKQDIPPPATFGLGATAADDELTSRIQNRVESCAGSAARDALQDVVTESVKAAFEARDKYGATTESIQKAAGDAAVASAGKAGVSLPIGFLKCVALEPVARVSAVGPSLLAERLRQRLQRKSTRNRADREDLRCQHVITTDHIMKTINALPSYKTVQRMPIVLANSMGNRII